MRLQLVAGEKQAETALRADTYLSRPFSLQYDGGTYASAWNPAATAVRDTLAELLSGVSSGEHTDADAIAVGNILAQILFPVDAPSIMEALKKAGEVSLSGDGLDLELITDLPWEMTRLPGVRESAGKQQLRSTLLAYPFCRTIATTTKPIELHGRLRVLLCAAEPSPANPASGVSQKTVSPEVFRKTFDEAFQAFPVIDVYAPEVVPKDLTFGRFEATVRNRRPHILVLVAHGRSGAQPGDPTEVLFTDGWKAAKQVARVVAETGQTALLVWCCCDLVRSPDHSAAAASIQVGLAEAIAMQGAIHQTVMATFLQGFLTDVLAGASTAQAAAQGRLSCYPEAHAFLPTVFRNSTASPEPTVGGHLGRYKTRLRTLRAQFAKNPQPLNRDKIQPSIEKLLKRRGLAFLSGPPGVGKKTLLAAAAHASLQMKVPQRPIFTFPRLANRPSLLALSGLWREMSKWLSELQDLLPDDVIQALPESDAAALVEILDKSRSVFLVNRDGLRLDNGSKPFWDEVTTLAKGMTQSLLLVVASEQLDPTVRADQEVKVEFCSLEETRSFVERYLPDMSDQADGIHAQTGGTALLLEALRVRVAESGSFDLSKTGVLSPDSVEAAYVRTIMGGLAAWEIATLQTLVRLVAPANEKLVRDYLVPDRPARSAADNNDPIEILLRVGLLHKSRLDGTSCFVIPEAKREWIARHRGRVPKAELLRESRGLVERLKDAGSKGIVNIYRQPHGSAVLQAAQSALLEAAEHAEENWELAFFIPTLCDDRSGESLGLLQLYTAVINSPASLELRTKSRIRGAAIARGLNKSELASQWLAEVDEKSLADYEHVQLLLTRARVNKELYQKTRLQEIHEDLDKGLEIANRDPTRLAEPEWRQLAADLRQTRIDVRLFLEFAAVEDVNDELAKLEQILPEGPQLANCLATITERGMKGSGVDWAQVGNSAARGYQLSQKTNDHRVRSYAAYQYGRYLERMPGPVYVDAEAMYAEADREAELAGSATRGALAAFRSIYLRWQHLKALDGREAARLLERQILRIGLVTNDSLSLRTLQKLYGLRAEIGQTEKLGPIDRTLLEACRVATRLPTGSIGDNLRFANDCVRLFSLYKELGAFVKAQQAMQELRVALESRLQIDTSSLDPWKLEAELRQRYNSPVGDQSTTSSG